MGRSVIMHALMSFMVNAGYETPPTPTPTLMTPTTTTAATTTSTILPMHSQSSITDQGCYQGYGCFPIDGVWAGPERPVALYPHPPPELMPTFCLHTSTRPSCQTVDLGNLSTLHESFHDLSASSSIILLTHGYLESTQLEWVQGMVEALLSMGKDVGEGMGVVTVDWSHAALPTYAQAVANVRLVGVMVGQLLEGLTRLGISPSAMHLVGHSLGAHLMAYAANHLSHVQGKQVGRLTGLDPAGPYFTNTSLEVRLDPSDAAFVDVIHTDVPTQEWELNRLGYAEALGHLDFYPNDGHQQAGCQGSAAAHIQRWDNVAGGVLSYLGCSHQRSHQFFTESILNHKCQFLGVECSSWEQYKAGQCWGCDGGHCQVMGYPATRPEGETEEGEGEKGASSPPSLPSPKKFFLGTDSTSPFCAEQYRMTLVSSPSSATEGEGGARGRVAGGDVARFTVTVRGHLRTLTIPALSKDVWVEAGGQVSWVGWGSGDLGEIYNLRVEYEVEQDLLQALVWRFRPPTLYVEEFTMEVLSTGVMLHFPFCGSRMQAGESYTLLPDACPT